MATHVVIDRRLNSGAKSLENRQRFLRRARAQVQGAASKKTNEQTIKDALEGGEVSIPIKDLREPQLRRSGGRHEHVVPGNREFVVGDIIPRPDSGGGAIGRKAGEGDSEENFRFALSREELIDLFFNDLELPDLAKRKLSTTEAEGYRRAGYTTSGSPASISIRRTSELALMRRIALRRPKKDGLEALETELEACTDEITRMELAAQIEALKARMRIIPFIDPIDIRYRRFEQLPKPISQAVMFCLMDVSGSMTEHMKDLAKRFYMLLHIFLTRRYRHVEIVFIRHTDRAEEVDEQTFFYGPASGGTTVSSALIAMRHIIAQRFRPSDWNIYAAQASDGDNLTSDNALVSSTLTDAILPICQFFAYLEVGQPSSHGPSAMPDSGLWTLYSELKKEGAPIAIQKVFERNEIFPIFRDLFKKRGKTHA